MVAHTTPFFCFLLSGRPVDPVSFIQTDGSSHFQDANCCRLGIIRRQRSAISEALALSDYYESRLIAPKTLEDKTVNDGQLFFI